MKKAFTVGRDASADIPIADPSVSRIHAELSLVSDRLRVSDRGSSNGTFLLCGGVERRIQDDTALPADHLKFGAVILAAADLIAAIRRKSPAELKLVTSVRLLRCDCGAVKQAGQRCPSCKTP